MGSNLKRRKHLALYHSERKVLAEFFLARCSVIFGEIAYDNDRFSRTLPLQDIKPEYVEVHHYETVREVWDYCQKRYSNFAETLSNDLEKFLEAVLSDARSCRLTYEIKLPYIRAMDDNLYACLYLRRGKLVKDIDDDSDELEEIDENIANVIYNYKRMEKQELASIINGLQDFVNTYFFQNRKNEKARKLAWLMLQLFPLAFFISLNLAKNECPRPMAEGKLSLDKIPPNFLKIGDLLYKTSQCCFNRHTHERIDPLIQSAFQRVEFNAPHQKAFRKKPVLDSPNDDFPFGYLRQLIGQECWACTVFKEILECSQVVFQSGGIQHYYLPDKNLNWMAFEQLTGFLTNCDILFDRIKGILPPELYRGSACSTVLRQMEEHFQDFNNFKSQDFLYEDSIFNIPITEPIEFLSQYISYIASSIGEIHRKTRKEAGAIGYFDLCQMYMHSLTEHPIVGTMEDFEEIEIEL